MELALKCKIIMNLFNCIVIRGLLCDNNIKYKHIQGGRL